MQKFFKRVVERKILIPTVFLILMAVSLLMLPLVTVNYDLAEYLPENAGTKAAIKKAKEEFDYPGTANVMAEDITIGKAYELKQKIKAIDGVKSVIWLDDFVDILMPVQQIPEEYRDNYYKDNCALFQVEFEEDNYSPRTSEALVKIRQLDTNLRVTGEAESSRSMKELLAGEIFKIIVIVVPVCVLILMIASYSWIEPLLYLIVLGVAIAVNMGTNAFFSSISFITNSMASVLQLAICMDYSIFLLHRYFEERDNGSDAKTAVITAASKSLSSIAASALTTVAGFVSLLFMQYGIGADIGLVLAKGVIISFLCVILLMPVLILLFSKLLDKTRHKPLMPSFRLIGKAVLKVRYVIIILALLVIVPSLLAQSRNDYFYGDNTASVGAGKAYEDRTEIKNKFGITNTVMILVPRGNTSKEITLCNELKNIEHTSQVTALVTMADPSIPVEFLPDSVKDNFVSENYSRIILNFSIEGEQPEGFVAVTSLRDVLQKHYPDSWYAAGLLTSLSDIKDTVNNDSVLVAIASIVTVGLVVLFTFRSISVPLILLLVIQASIWINMAIPYFQSFKMAYIGYLVISSLQLGATIDYAILLSNRYLEFRNIYDPKQSAKEAIRTAAPSILVSALVLATAGFTFGIVSKVGSISELGNLIGRGAVLSGLLTIVLLPALLTVLDKLIFKTTLIKK